MCTPNVEIASLLPYESAGVFHRVLSFFNIISEGAESDIPPIDVFTFEEHTLVREGTNRVIAYRLHNRTHIPARVVGPPEGEDLLRFTIELRLQDGMLGFAHFPIDQTDADRKHRTQQEFQIFLNQ